MVPPSSSTIELIITDQFCSVDQGIYGNLTLRNLAVPAEERGDRAEARPLWNMVLDTCPGDAEATSRREAALQVEELRARQCRPDALRNGPETTSRFHTGWGTAR